MIVVTSTINLPQTLDSVVLPAYGSQKRAVASAAILAAAAAKTLYYNELKGDAKHLDTEYEYTPLTGTTVALPDDAEAVRFKHGSTIAALTVNPPGAPKDGQEFVMTFTSAVTALTMTGLNSQTIVGAMTAATAGGFGRYKYEKASNSWSRVG